jgi:hypothetical protein
VVIIINSLLDIWRASHIAVFHEFLKCLPQVGSVSEPIRRYRFSPAIAVSLPIFMKVRTEHIMAIRVLMRRAVTVQTQEDNDNASAVLVSGLEPVDPSPAHIKPKIFSTVFRDERHGDGSPYSWKMELIIIGSLFRHDDKLICLILGEIDIRHRQKVLFWSKWIYLLVVVFCC